MRVMQGENEGSERTSESRSMNKRGIIIANTGSPSAPTPEAVRAYLRDFLSDPRICPMNPTLWNIILERFILPRRSVASAEKYASIWTPDGSPLALIMDLLATRLQDAFDQRGGEAIVRSAMSYSDPTLSDAVVELVQAGCEELVVIPLYPQGAYSTTKVVQDKFETALAKLPAKARVRFIEDYCECDQYVRAIAQSVFDAGFDPAKDKLLFAFHSIPVKDIEAGDRYPELVYASAEAIAALMGAREEGWKVGFQCRFDKSRKWLGPYIVEAMEDLIADGMDMPGRLFVVTPNFSIDCLETLYDIEVELKQAYLRGIPGATKERFVYVPCLNDSDAQVDLLVSLVKESC